MWLGTIDWLVCQVFNIARLTRPAPNANYVVAYVEATLVPVMMRYMHSDQYLDDLLGSVVS